LVESIHAALSIDPARLHVAGVSPPLERLAPDSRTGSLGAAGFFMDIYCKERSSYFEEAMKSRVRRAEFRRFS